MYRSTLEQCAKLHADVNHLYDGNPYGLHLNMAYMVYEEFKHLLDDDVDYFTGKVEYGRDADNVTLREACGKAIPGHDLIEDARLTYNDVKNLLGAEAAEIIYAVTNEKGKTRKERAGESYYRGIRETKGAVFTKLCDRIANIRYGKMMKSHKHEMYHKEQIGFIKGLGLVKGHELMPMFECLEGLF